FSSRRRHTRFSRDWSSDVCSSDLLEEAQAWVDRFVRWYNEEHRHSALNWVTPMARHTGEDRELLRRREETYRRARRRNPHRWSEVGRASCRERGRERAIGTRGEDE